MVDSSALVQLNEPRASNLQLEFRYFDLISAKYVLLPNLTSADVLLLYTYPMPQVEAQSRAGLHLISICYVTAECPGHVSTFYVDLLCFPFSRSVIIQISTKSDILLTSLCWCHSMEVL